LHMFRNTHSLTPSFTHHPLTTHPPLIHHSPTTHSLLTQTHRLDGSSGLWRAQDSSVLLFRIWKEEGIFLSYFVHTHSDRNLALLEHFQ
jgi:hypothetical protein